MNLKVIAIDTPSLGDRSYLVHDGAQALVVDPQRDIDRVQLLAEQEGVTIAAVAETHMHNDYVSGGLELARLYGAHYLVSAEDPVRFTRREMSDGDVVSVGSFGVQALHTPGHTFTHLSFSLLAANGETQGVFTGGSLLHGSTGRPDLLGPEHAPTLAGLQHGSARRLSELLEAKTSIYPTHGFGSFCAATPTSGTASTIEDERRVNPALLLQREQFIKETLAGLDAFPAYYRHMGPANLAGPSSVDLTALPAADRASVERAIASGAWAVDVRPRAQWCSGHIPGSIPFGTDGSMATYLGWIFPYERQLLLVSDSAQQVAVAQRELVRIGIDRPAAAMVAPREQLDGRSTRRVTFSEVAAVLSDPGKLVLDVRRNSEREGSHVLGTHHIPLHELERRVEEIPPHSEIWVHCAGAYRAAAAVGILERSGRTAVLIDEPYSAALGATGLTIVRGTSDHTPVAPSDEPANP
jgi:glyoxylase-like metal-dependent hydrolase (beta-lactamase superfamily II)/rhodanese-related sulfurtransferase